MTTTHTIAQINPEAEKYISKMLNKNVPYEVKILDSMFIIKNTNVYPPGQLTEMFAKFLLENDLIKNKVIADVGAGCFALGIISAKNGAKKVIGTDINNYAITCARENIALNNVKNNTYLLHCSGLKPLLPKFKGKIDIILSGTPWDTISSDEYNNIPKQRKPISRAFYDVENVLISDILSQGVDLVSPQGRIFITASMKTMWRIEQLCSMHNVHYKVVKAEDLHNDGNIHYILEISSLK